MPSRSAQESGLAEDEAGGEEISAEELLKQLKVSDLLLGTLASLVQLGYAKLAEDDLEQTRLAIDVLRAVMPVLEDSSPPDVVRDLRQATANLQLAYASKVNETPDQPDDDSKGET
jgi:hypothetical protein